MRPIHEIAARIVGIFVGVENIDDAEFADRDDQPVGGLRAAELIGTGFDFLGVAAEIDGLADERALHAQIWHWSADLIGLAAGKPGGAHRAAQAKTLIDFRIDPHLGALPQPHAEIGRGVPGLAPLVGIEAVAAHIGIAKREDILLEECRLAVDGEIVGFGRGGTTAASVDFPVSPLSR